jgi:hypothetical protein
MTLGRTNAIIGGGEVSDDVPYLYSTYDYMRLVLVKPTGATLPTTNVNYHALPKGAVNVYTETIRAVARIGVTTSNIKARDMLCAYDEYPHVLTSIYYTDSSDPTISNVAIGAVLKTINRSFSNGLSNQTVGTTSCYKLTDFVPYDKDFATNHRYSIPFYSFCPVHVTAIAKEFISYYSSDNSRWLYGFQSNFPNNLPGSKISFDVDHDSITNLVLEDDLLKLYVPSSTIYIDLFLKLESVKPI